MEYVGSFNAIKTGKAYVVYVYDLHPDGDIMPFQVDTGASVTFLGLNSFCNPERKNDYELLKRIIEKEIILGKFEGVKDSASTATREEVEMYPCKYKGVSISGTRPITLYFYIYLGDVSVPLLGFDYIDDCSYHHSIGGELVVNAVAEDVGKRFYPDNLMDFNRIMETFCKERSH